MAPRPIFEPWERLQMLGRAAEDVGGRTGEAIRSVVIAACTVVRQMQGSADRAMAYAQVARAQTAIRALTRGKGTKDMGDTKKPKPNLEKETVRKESPRPPEPKRLSRCSDPTRTGEPQERK